MTQQHHPARRWLRQQAARGVQLARDIVPAPLHDRVPARLRRLAGRLLATGRTRARALDDKLWSGFSSSAMGDLAALRDDPAIAPVHRSDAAYSLARWFAAGKDFEAALAQLRLSGEIAPWRRRFRRHYLLQAQWLCRLHRPSEARAVLDAAPAPASFDASLELTRANTFNRDFLVPGIEPDDLRVLDHINTVFLAFDLCPIALRDPALPLSMDNIVGLGTPAIDRPDAAVTVIVPVYNAAPTVETALRSLAEQSWRALRVIVVDDASTDDTAAVVARFCAADPRFRLIEKTQNSGSYASRNLALEQVETPFVSVHDGDDWSHPQKIERQMAALLGSKAPYNYTMWARATPGLGFIGDVKPYHQLLGPDHSAGLFRTADVRRVGGWDMARISADTELFWRLEALGGATREHSRGRRVLTGCPLAFGRHIETSLTQHGPTHALTMFHGVRREYREAADFWHRGLKSAAGLKPPFFPAPAIVRPWAAEGRQLDLLLIGNLASRGPETESLLDMARLARRAGKATGLLHYPAYRSDVTRPLHARVRQFALEGDIAIIAPGERLDARTAIIGDAEVFEHRMDRFPEVAGAHWLALLHSTMNGDPADTGDRAGDRLAATINNLRMLCDSRIGLRAKSDRLRARLEAMLPDTLGPTPVWLPVIDPEAVTPPARARRPRRRPLIGRVARDSAENFPLDRQALLAAYCGDRACDVRFFGGLESARVMLGRLPRNWRGIDPRSRGVGEFLAGLDLFVDFSSGADEQTGRNVLAAMASGVPVILPPHYESTFGPAARYSSPDAVWTLVSELWQDEQARRAQAALGRRFVEDQARRHEFLGLLAQ